MSTLYVNFFQPSFKLLSKTRVGAKVRKKYDKPATPCDRLLAHAAIPPTTKEALRSTLASLDPLAILHGIRNGQTALAVVQSGGMGRGADRQSLEDFFAQLPEMWRSGEVRSTHRTKDPSPRHWRTHKDAFEDVWPEILLWLQEAPDATGKSLLERLQRAYPGRFPRGQLRTLQRRISEWRHVMARTLVHSCLEGDKEPVIVAAEKKTVTLDGQT